MHRFKTNKQTKLLTLSTKHFKLDSYLSKAFKKVRNALRHIQQLEKQDGRQAWDMQGRQKLCSWVKF